MAYQQQPAVRPVSPYVAADYLKRIATTLAAGRSVLLTAHDAEDVRAVYACMAASLPDAQQPARTSRGGRYGARG